MISLQSITGLTKYQEQVHKTTKSQNKHVLLSVLNNQQVYITHAKSQIRLNLPGRLSSKLRASTARPSRACCSARSSSSRQSSHGT